MSNRILEEANRCLQCKNPRCKAGCPVSTPIPDVIRLLKESKIEEAGKMLFENNPLSLVCSYICPQENQCEGHCVLGIKGKPVQFGMIEQYISDFYLNIFTPDTEQVEKQNMRAAVIGSGPAGITIAYYLAKMGYGVTIFESFDKIGGVMRYGIPEFRLPKMILTRLKMVLIQCGVNIRPNMAIGTDITVDDLLNDGYSAIFMGTGVWRPNRLGLKGESLGNVHYAINYLHNPDVYVLGKKVAVIGGGNTAMDVARTVIRHGCNDVTLIFNREEEALTSRKIESDFARLDGAKFLYNKSCVEFRDEGVVLADSKVLEDGSVDIVPGTEELFEADSTIIAIGQGPRSVIVKTTKGIDVTSRGLVAVDEYGRTTREGIFASGDVVTGAKTVVAAVNISRKVAQAMHEYMQSIKAKA